MLLYFMIFVCVVNVTVFFFSRFDLMGCSSDAEVDESLDRYWRIFRYVILMNVLVNSLFFWSFYKGS